MAYNVRNIFNTYLICNQEVTLRFESKRGYRSFLSSLYNYKSRVNVALAKDEFGDVLAGKSIRTEILHDSFDGVTARFWIGYRDVTHHSFEILSASPIKES